MFECWYYINDCNLYEIKPYAIVLRFGYSVITIVGAYQFWLKIYIHSTAIHTYTVLYFCFFFSKVDVFNRSLFYYFVDSFCLLLRLSPYFYKCTQQHYLAK